MLSSNFEFYARLDGKRGNTVYFSDQNNERITTLVNELSSHDAEFIALYPLVDTDWYKMFNQIKAKDSATPESWFAFQKWCLNDELRRNKIIYGLDVPSHNKMDYFKKSAKTAGIVLLDEIKSQQVDLSRSKKITWFMFRSRSSITQVSENEYTTILRGEFDSYKVTFLKEHLNVFNSINQTQAQINGTIMPWYFTLIRGKVVEENGSYSIKAEMDAPDQVPARPAAKTGDRGPP